MLNVPQILPLSALGGLGGLSPTLDLRFANDKFLDSRITYTGASLRRVHDNAGVLVISPHNLLLRSEALDNSDWTKDAEVTVSANQQIDPDGVNTTADEVTWDGTDNKSVRQNFTGIAQTIYTFSVWLKLITGTVSNIARINMFSNLLAEVINDVSGTIDGTWRRFSITGTADGDGGAITAAIRFDDNVTVAIWGAQVVVGASQLDYNVTDSAAFFGPRFDHLPVSPFTSLGLLIEEARTNFAPFSESFGDWSKTNTTVTADQALGADGKTTADQLDISAGSSDGVFKSGHTSVAGRNYALSVWARTASGTKKLRFKIWDGTVNTFSAEFTVTTTLTRFTAVIQTPNSGSGNYGVHNQAAGGAATVFLWGYQMEENAAFSTSYIATTAASVARALDVATMTDLSWYDETAGTWFFHGDLLNSSIGGFSNGLFAMKGSGANDAVRIAIDGGNGTQATTRVGGGDNGDALPTSSTWNAGVRHRVAFAFAEDDLGASFDGGTVATDSSADLPINPDLFRIGSKQDGLRPLNGHADRITYWPTRRPNADLVSLTL